MIDKLNLRVGIIDFSILNLKKEKKIDLEVFLNDRACLFCFFPIEVV